jgi:membrane protease YdiL (CAAX protease family)
MDGLIGTAAIVAMLLAAGAAIGAIARGGVAWRWLFAAAGLVLLNDALLSRVWGLVPDLLPAASWNWQGKLCALVATLAVAALPAFGWRASGITLRQARGSLLPCALVALGYTGFFVAIALLRPNDPLTPETIAFQLTMPGLEEEAFYRGVLLLALDRAFPARWRFLGVDWGWGAILSSALFGLAHAFAYDDGAFAFSALAMALTAGPALIAVWLRLRSGSIAWPVALHNFGNAIGFVL